MNNVDAERMREDLAYVKEAVKRRRAGDLTPPSILVLWGVICLVGFVLNDFAPRFSWWFWCLVPAAGFVLSLVLGWRSSRRTGEVNWQEFRVDVLHWAGLGGALAVLFSLYAVGTLRGIGFYQALLLVLALAYYFAGVHLDRAFVWVALLLAAGAVGFVFFRTYLNATLGVLICVTLVVPALMRRGKNGSGT